MSENSWNTQKVGVASQTSNPGRDMPSGLRSCPFCHALIPNDIETCPSCGRILVERFDTGARKTAQPARGRREPSQWRRTLTVQLARATSAVRGWLELRTRPVDDRRTTMSRGESWSVFRPVGNPRAAWWPGSMPAPSEGERRAFIITAAIMVFLFIAALIGARR